MFVGSLHKAKCQFKNNTKPKGLRKVPNHELPGYQHSLTQESIRKNTDCDQESGSSGTVNRIEQPLSVSTITTIPRMATAELINPVLSRSESTDSSPSPDSSRQPQRRTALLRQQLSLDIPDQNRGLLSSSLPSPISKKELSFLKAIHQNEKNKRQKFKESKESLSQSMEAAEPGRSIEQNLMMANNVPVISYA